MIGSSLHVLGRELAARVVLETNAGHRFAGSGAMNH